MYQVLLVIQYFSIFVLMVEAGYILGKIKTKLHAYLFFNCVATLINNLGYLLEMLAKSEEQYLTALQMSYLGRVWIPYSLFIFMILLCKVNVNRKILMGLGVFHAATFFVVLTCQYQNWYYSSMTYVKEGMFPYIETKDGPWHHVYSFILLFYIVFGLYKLIQAVRKEQYELERKRLTYMVIAIAVESASFVINMTGIIGNYDITVLGYSIGAVFMYIAIFKYGLLDTLQLVKDYVIDGVSELILAINNQGELEYYNQTAKQAFPDIEKRFASASTIEQFQQATKEHKPLYIKDKIYSVEVKELRQNDCSRGNVYVLVDETEQFRYMKELEEQKEIAEAANASKSRFLSVVSHEIRTPMNAVVGMTELLLREPESLNSKQEKYLKNIKNSGAALVMIVNDILDQSKIEAGKMELVEDVYELRPMAEDVRMIIENRIGEKPIDLIYEIDEKVPRYLMGDSLRIRQILINLMNNAVKFTEEGYVKLTVTCEKEDENRGLFRFSIKDSGLGIKPEDLSKLGQAFTQVDTKKNHQKEGTGLGLSISRDFISMMGGKLSVESEYGHGSEFYFSIWQGIAEQMNVAKDAGICKQAWQEEEQFVAPKAKVLIVDDTKLNLMITKELLQPLRMDIDLANSGEKAIDKMKENRYDIVFMDYMMPYMDGIETTCKIRALHQEYKDNEEMMHYLKNVPIIALSGDDSEDTMEKFKNAGMDDFVGKPVELKQLKKCLIRWLPKDLIKPQD